ncbi:hypothetical protein J0910_30715 [Nocardiopsis sp. CNT-189]|uniref:hypothetical protein n=1 Tax=Nocardiopsis oceanisediminis TaxID=2816862 RepID=UPI003B2EE7CF
MTCSAREEVAAALGEAAAGRIRLRRVFGPRAAALAAVLEALGRADRGRRDPDTAPARPDRAPDGRTGALVAEVPSYAADDPYQLRRRLRELGGPAALLRPYAPGADDPLAMGPLEHLSARYASRAGREAAEAWRARLQPLPAREAVLAARTDPAADAPTRLAGLEEADWVGASILG